MYLRQSIQTVLGLVFLVISSFALSNTEFNYNNNGESIEIIGCENICPLNLVIPNEIDGLPVTKIGWAAFSNNHLTSVFIPNSVTTIANLAFDNNNLSSVVIPESVETIGWLAFSNNNLQAVSLPSGIERLEDGVFYSNELTDILIPDNVTFIGVDAFRENDIKNITLSNNLMLISSYAFSGNDINNLTIPSTVVSIDERAFFQNHLVTVTFLGDRPAIGKEAFALSSENDESYWGTTYQNCSNDISTDSMNCDTIGKDYTTGDGYLTLGFCDSTSGWPGESIFIVDIQESYICDGLTPEVCFEDWTKWVTTPQQLSDCPLNVNPTTNSVANYSVFDLDQNGSFEALTDALILLRYAFGLRGDNLINGAIATDANRTAASEIEVHIQSYLP